MTTRRFVIELRWSRNQALALAIALALPILAITGLITALAAHPRRRPGQRRAERQRLISNLALRGLKGGG